MTSKEYWDTAALDPQVDDKYICDIDTKLCLRDLGAMTGDVLEIGCGVGRLLKDGYYGIDISENMIRIAKNRKPRSYCTISINGAIPYAKNSFDNVYCYLVFQHLKPYEIQQYIKEAYRVLKVGGKFVFQYIQGTEREPLSNHYTQTEMTAYLQDTGFNTVFSRQSVAHELWSIMGAYK